MCELKKCLPLVFFNAQEHYLIHLVKEIEICGLVHTRSIWMMERNLKALKDFVRQRLCPEGSMVEVYMVYQSIVYISEYLHEVASPHITMLRIWDIDSKKKR